MKICIFKEAMTYWVSIVPTLVKQVPPHNEYNKLGSSLIEDMIKLGISKDYFASNYHAIQQ